MAVSGSRKKVWRNGEGVARDAARGDGDVRGAPPSRPANPGQSSRPLHPDGQTTTALECWQGHCHIGWARQAARGARMSSGAQAPTDGLIT